MDQHSGATGHSGVRQLRVPSTVMALSVFQKNDNVLQQQSNTEEPWQDSSVVWEV